MAQDATSNIEQILEAARNETAAVRTLTFYLYNPPNDDRAWITIISLLLLFSLQDLL